MDIYQNQLRAKQAAEKAYSEAPPFAPEIPGGGQLANMAAQPARESQVMGAAHRHGNSLSRLRDRITMLAERLDPIMRPATPSPTNGQKEAKAVERRAPMAQALHETCDVIDQMTFDLEEILGRLEI